MPILHGFISAAGIVIMLGQIPSLFGVKVGSGTGTIIHDLFAQIPDFKGPTVGIGLGGIVMLVAMQKIGQKYGSKSKAIWYLVLGRAAIVLVLFTGISYGVNKNINLKKDDPIWELSKVKVRMLSTAKRAHANSVAVRWHQGSEDAPYHAICESVPQRHRALPGWRHRASCHCQSLRTQERLCHRPCPRTRLSWCHKLLQQLLLIDASRWCHVAHSRQLVQRREEPRFCTHLRWRCCPFHLCA